MLTTEEKTPPLYYHEIKGHLASLDQSFRLLGNVSAALADSTIKAAGHPAYPESINRAIAAVGMGLASLRRDLQIAAMELYSLTERDNG